MVFHDQKLQRIKDLLEQRPYWQSRELADKLGISRSTVQRCLQELENLAIARRVHGGVRRVTAGISNTVSVDERLSRDHQAKEQIAQAAINLIPQSGYVFLDAGTTLMPLAQRLEQMPCRDVMFVTNGIALAQIVTRLGLKHMLLAGQVHPVTQSISGPMTLELIRQFYFAACFISADAVDEHYGVTCSLHDESLVKAEVLRRSDRKVLLAPAVKWKQKAGAVIAPMNCFDYWVSETYTDDALAACRHNGIETGLAK